MEANHLNWLHYIRDAICNKVDFEDKIVPSDDALRFHWLRCHWVRNVWLQADKQQSQVPSVEDTMVGK